MEYKIILTEIEYKAMQFIILSIQEWIDNVVHARASEAINEIVNIYIDYALANNIPIPSSRDEIVLEAYKIGIIKTGEERNKIMEKSFEKI